MRVKRIILYFVLVAIMFAFNFYLRPIKGNKLITPKYKDSAAYVNDLYMSDEYFKKKILPEENYFIYDKIIEGSTEDLGTVEIKCFTDCEKSFYNAYYAVYLDHPELISFLGISAFMYEDGAIKYNNYQNLGKIAVDVVGGNIDKIIPTFITSALPEWFVYVFLLSLIAAAMSTISSQLHTQGTAFGVDIYGTIRDKSKQKLDQVSISRVGILIAIILALVMAFSLPGSVVALGTSLFFEICAAAFLPVFLGALYWKGITRLGAIAGIVSGTIVSLFWLMFVFAKTAKGLGICMALFGAETLLPTAPWPFIDVMLIAVPVSAIFTIVVSLLTKPPAQNVIDEAFKNIDDKGSEA